MATNHTENYQLNLWEPGDAFLRTEFNENTQKIEEALAALNAGQVRYCIIPYTGDGEATRTHTFPFAPKVVVFVTTSDSYGNVVLFPGQSSAHRCYMGSNDRLRLAWGENTLTLTGDSTYVKDTVIFNQNNYSYYILAFR